MRAFWQSLRRIGNVFLKSMREIWRDWLTLSLSLVFAPLFILLYYLITAGGSTSYRVIVINLDQGVAGSGGEMVSLGSEVIQAIEAVTYADGQPMLRVSQAASQAEAEAMLRERAATAFVILPTDLTRIILAMQSGDTSQAVRITFGGDLTNPYYSVAGILALSAIEGYVQKATGQLPLIEYTEAALGASGTRTEFEIYVPGILIFAVSMLVFLAAMTAAREVEAGTLQRLQLSRLSSFELLIGLSLALVLVGLAAELLAYAAAVACGFHSQGPAWVVLLVGVLASLSVIGSGLIVAAFSRSVSQAFIIANFPLALFMFFSGLIYPLPKVVIFSLGGQEISLYDILPPTHAVAALNKVFVMGAGLSEVSYELGALTVLTLLYFAFGGWLFKRTQMQ